MCLKRWRYHRRDDAVLSLTRPYPLRGVFFVPAHVSCVMLGFVSCPSVMLSVLSRPAPFPSVPPCPIRSMPDPA